jgi:hypothetical protein
MPAALERLSQARAVRNGIFPQSLNNSRASTSSVDMSKFQRALFTLYVGAVTSGSISAWLQESADDSSWTANDTAGAFSGSGGSGVSSTGNTTSSAILQFEVKSNDLTPGKRYVRLQVKETAGSATIVCVTAEGGEASSKPASLQDGTHLATNGSKNVVS